LNLLTFSSITCDLVPLSEHTAIHFVSEEKLWGLLSLCCSFCAPQPPQPRNQLAALFRPCFKCLPGADTSPLSHLGEKMVSSQFQGPCRQVILSNLHSLNQHFIATTNAESYPNHGCIYNTSQVGDSSKGKLSSPHQPHLLGDSPCATAYPEPFHGLQCATILQWHLHDMSSPCLPFKSHMPPD
jgi:hypothetical protein